MNTNSTINLFDPVNVTLLPDESIAIRLLESADMPKRIDYFNDLSAQIANPNSF